MPQPPANIGTYKFQLSSGSLLDYLFICLLITINILQGTQLRGITVGLIYRGTEMSRGHSGWGDLSWLALMRHAAQTRKTACHWVLSWTDDIIRHSLMIQTWLALLKPAVMCGDRVSRINRTRTSLFVFRYINASKYRQWWNVTTDKYNYTSTAHKYYFELLGYFLFGYFILPLQEILCIHAASGPKWHILKWIILSAIE